MSRDLGVSLILCPRCRMTLVSPVFERDVLLQQHFRYGCQPRTRSLPAIGVEEPASRAG